MTRIQRDLYDRRPSVLKSWSRGHVTMLGDAVHPVIAYHLLPYMCTSTQLISLIIHTDDA